MIQDKKKDVEIGIGYVKHIGPTNSPRCALQDPNSINRRWLLKPGEKSGIMSLETTSNVYNWVKAHKHLEFCLVSSQVKATGGIVPPVAKAPETKIDKRHAEWNVERAKAKPVKVPKPMDENAMKGPSPKELLEGGVSPKELLEPAKKEPEVIKEEEAIDIYEYLKALDYDEAKNIAAINDIDLGRTSSLSGALNKIFKHMEARGGDLETLLPNPPG